LTLLLCRDQQQRWREGERPRVEDYLARHPHLGINTDCILQLLCGEFLLRQECGETPAIEEYRERFPNHVDALRCHLDHLAQLAAEVLSPTPRAGAFTSPEDADVPPTRVPFMPLSLAASGPAQQVVAVPGYEVLGLLGKGGMGVVYKARQLSLGRVVALKMILHAEHAGAEERRRFQVEAEAVARLQQANIVQVYEVGESQGLPYFSLEYCGGGSLADKLDGTPWEAQPAARLLETVARAVHVAHQAQVVHRDLKPANVLLTADGTPKVTDFGLAKRLDEKTRTQTGAVVGTPSYMAPEQAGGKKDVGPAADVYALGAILYELLVGRPPFKAATPLDTLMQVVSEDPVAVRRLQPKVPGDLETICHKCLQKDPKRRYSSAAVLAEDLRRFGACEPVAARPVRAPERLWRWARRKPAQAGLIAVVLLVLAAGTVVSTLFALEARRQADDARLSAEAAGREKTRAEEALAAEQQALAAKSQALAAETQARKRTREALDAMSSQVIEDWLARRGQLEPAQRAFLEKALAYYEAFAAESGRREEVRRGVADAHLRVGRMREQLGQHAEAEAAYRRAQELWASLAAGFPSVPQYRLELARCHTDLGNLLKDTGRAPKAEPVYRQAVVILTPLTAAFPAEPAYRQELARSHNSLGALLVITGRSEEGERSYHDAIEVQKQLAADFPGEPRYLQPLALHYNNLGILLQNTGHPKEAEAAYRDALAIRKRLVASFPRVPRYRLDLARSHDTLGLLLKNSGQAPQAEAAYRDALAVLKPLAAEFPTVPQYRQDLAHSYNHLGTLLQDTRQPQEAGAVYREALALCKRLAADFPAVPDYRQELAGSYDNLGNLLQETGQAKEAEAAYCDALDIRKRLAAEFPGVPEHQQDLARSLNNLGIMLKEAGRAQEAEAVNRDALDIQKRLVADLPGELDYRCDLAKTMVSLAELAHMRRDTTAARQLLEEARPHTDKALEAGPSWPYYKEVFRDHRQLLAVLRLQVGDHASAAEAAAELARVAPEPAKDAYNAASFFSRCIMLAEKDRQLSEARRQELAKSYGDQAVQTLRQALAKGYKDIAHLQKDKDLDPLRPRPDFQKLLAGLENGKPKSK
jgi:tetratricopeptide (TPR) repeat protein/predicted Ser/Thr protein kinase